MSPSRCRSLLGCALLAGASLAAAQPAADRSPCARPEDPRSLWACWAGGAATRAATCVPATACPPQDQNGKPVISCYYQKSWQTGYRCILFCDYGGPFPWGSDGGSNCD